MRLLSGIRLKNSMSKEYQEKHIQDQINEIVTM